VASFGLLPAAARRLVAGRPDGEERDSG